MKNFEVKNSCLANRFTINCRGKLIDLSKPVVMGILNLTPDSFYSGSRITTLDDSVQRVEEIISEGGVIVDIGAYSSRPGANDVSEQEEGRRLWPILDAIRKRWPDIIISVDTFRSTIAQKAVAEYEVDIINDISAGMMDAAMFETIARLNVPYILMHMKGTPQNMQKHPQYEDVTGEVLLFLSEKVNQLRALGVADIIIDPGFGFGKTLEHNYQLLRDLQQFRMFELPLLVGVSRKSMIYNALNSKPEEALNGTTVLHAWALTKGANILRVHDVKEAVECVKLVSKIME
ncbi:Dihydropteroate synthase [Thermophagus xiamenensis]|uniref:dihydropteroate synthase n=2 Tax=Thermophagus xiamenensis TaxID=385682 RepID=A0A1I2D6N0_9BACT|nr:Dihydropteroate synthase [Thermophagus xiamenensis]